MVNVDVELDLVSEVVGSSEGTKAASNRFEAVEGQDLDNEGEIGIRVWVLGKESEIRVWVWVWGGEGERGMVVGEEEEDGDREEEEWEDVSPGSHHFCRAGARA